MTSFGNSQPGGKRAAPRASAPLTVELSTGQYKQPATLREISRTGAKVFGVTGFTAGQDLEFRAGTVRAVGEVVWSEGEECAIAFDTPIAAAEVSRLRSLAAFVSGVTKNSL